MTTFTKWLLGFWRDTEGASLLEAAITIPVGAILLLGTIDISMGLYMQATGDKSMRAAARYLTRVAMQPACPTWAVNNAKNLAVYGTLHPSASDKPLIPGWSTNQTNNKVTVDCSNFPIITVSAEIPVPAFLPVSFLPSVWTLTPQHQEVAIGE